jgi:hypothetical protein
MAKIEATISILRPSKIDPNSDFWFENIPSGNPVLKIIFWKDKGEVKQKSNLFLAFCV